MGKRTLRPAIDPLYVSSVEVAGQSLDIAATNKAVALYEETFLDTMTKPYTGKLIKDILLERDTLLQQDEQYPSWDDMPCLLRAIWAMATAAGSTSKSWSVFKSQMEDAPANMYEPAYACNTIFGEFGERTFFRLPKSIKDSLKSDAGQKSD
ncbi:hypothetical protein [Atopobium fossor]|uniref:hypothetical protein n=1 Tax=Atopobium fossor TaxID=39487 RepID=UPI0004089BB7|nr:hypothetical protein [Atopobium fossor]